MSVGLGVPSASALFFNMCMFSPRMQRDHRILLTIRTDIKRPLENETLHLGVVPSEEKGKISFYFFFFLLSPIMIISSGSTESSRLVKRNRFAFSASPLRRTRAMIPIRITKWVNLVDTTISSESKTTQ